MLVLLPPVIGVIFSINSDASASIELYRLMFSTFVPILFPLLTVLLFVSPQASEMANNFHVYRVVRSGFWKTFLHHIAVAFGSAAILMTIMGLVAGLFAFFIIPRWGAYPLLPPNFVNNGRGNVVTSAYTFTQLLSRSNFEYVLGYSAWLGLNGAIITAVATVSLYVFSRRILALCLPFIVYHVDNLVLALLGQETHRTIAAVFPFSIEQQTISSMLLTPLGWTALLISLVGIAWWKHRRDFLLTA